MGSHVFSVSTEPSAPKADAERAPADLTLVASMIVRDLEPLTDASSATGFAIVDRDQCRTAHESRQDKHDEDRDDRK